MHRLPLVFLLYLLPLFSHSARAYTWPSPQYDAVETLLYEGRRSDGLVLSSLVAPCRKRGGTGSSVPAEWLRFAFHDMATHNVDDGTGGMDGSIVYELGRAENFGMGFNDTRNDFQAFPNNLISRADVIAIGGIMAVATCGGPIIPFHAGRVDVWQAQSSNNTPLPQDDIQTLRESFRKQGFTSAEMIKLTACGHTMGGVRSTDFPDLVAPPSSNSSSPNIVNFDSTTRFDNTVVTEYLSGTTQNVLVVTSNATMASDLRVFSSDGNSTMQSLANNSTFMSDCKTLLGRMLDTVASNVTLSGEVTLLPAKVTAAQLTFENNKFIFKSSFRLTQPINQTSTYVNRLVTMYWCDAYGSNKNCGRSASSALPVSNTTDDTSLVSPVTTALGYAFARYEFVVPIDPSASISNFWFEASDGTVYNNGGKGYVIDQDQVLFVPTLSHADSQTASSTELSSRMLHRRGGGPIGAAAAQNRIYSLIVAVKTSFSPSRIYIDATDVATPNFTHPFFTTFDLTKNSSSYPTTSGYDFYYGRVTSPGSQMMVDVHAVGGGRTLTQSFVSTLLLGNNTSLVDPANVTTVKGKKSSAVRGKVGVEMVIMMPLVLSMWVLLG